jgi:hypothetical protein
MCCEAEANYRVSTFLGEKIPMLFARCGMAENSFSEDKSGLLRYNPILNNFRYNVCSSCPHEPRRFTAIQIITLSISPIDRS